MRGVFKKQNAFFIADTNEVSVALTACFVCWPWSDIEDTINLKPSAILPLQSLGNHVTQGVYVKLDLNIDLVISLRCIDAEMLTGHEISLLLQKRVNLISAFKHAFL